MRYFKDRQEAGRLLANNITHHKAHHCVVLSLSDGGVVVGAEIAKTLHAGLFNLVTEEKELPGELDPVASANSAGSFMYSSRLLNNNAYSTGELELIKAESYPSIQQERMNAFQKINRVADKEDYIPRRLLKNHIVVLVSDGFRNGISLDVAADFLKPIAIKKLIVASPIASTEATDKIHLLADEIVCLEVVENFISINHYYEDNSIPSHEKIIDKMRNIVFEW
ncbi:hypothetical protein KY385_03875 [Candidatus Parcubacteria bacterium]|nr:hypothetical protein [Candidatus Parcubacteria bacterium]